MADILVSGTTLQNYMTHKKNPEIKISKLDAAKRQLETAIRLYFNDADPVSIHTLACAAHGILSNLNMKRGGNPMIVSDALIKEEHKEEFRKILTKAKNHFKHADRDPETVIDFNPEVNEYFLFDACEKYQELTSEKVPCFIIYRMWFAVRYPTICIFAKDKHDKIQKYVEKYKNNKIEIFLELMSVSNIIK